MRITFDTPAPEGTLFSEESMPQTGYRIPVTVEGEAIGTGTLVEVRIIDGGKSARCTVELDQTPAMQERTRFSL